MFTVIRSFNVSDNQISLAIELNKFLKHGPMVPGIYSLWGVAHFKILSLKKKKKKEDTFLFKSIRTEDSVVVIVAYKNKLYHIHTSVYKQQQKWKPYL